MRNLIRKKTRTFAYDNKNKCQIKKENSSTRFLFAVSAILFRNLCRLCQISSGRDGRASKLGRRPIEHTGTALPILAALPLVQTNRLMVTVWYDLSSLLILLQTTTFIIFQSETVCRRLFYM